MAGKGRQATKLGMGEIKEAIAGGYGAPAIAAKFLHGASSGPRAVKRIRGAPKEREAGTGREAADGEGEEIEATL